MNIWDSKHLYRSDSSISQPLLQVFQENSAKELYTFATVAIDPRNVENVFSSVKDIIFSKATDALNLN